MEQLRVMRIEQNCVDGPVANLTAHITNPQEFHCLNILVHVQGLAVFSLSG